MTEPTADTSGEARFKWKTLALWSLTFALVSLTALAVVATITTADTLSVVALALAVLAFVVQIIVFIVQGNAASQQAADTAALNAQTLRALATIEEKSEGTRETVVKMNDRLFEFAFNKASLEAESSGAPQPVLEVLARAKEIIEAESTAVTAAPSPAINITSSATPITAGASNPPVKPLLDKPLTRAEVDEVEHLVESLDLQESRLPILSLSSLGQDLLAAEKAGRAEQAGISTINADAILYEHGLVRRRRVSWSSLPQFVLTDKGRLVAKALLITPAPPSEKIVALRRYVEDFQASIARDRAESKRIEDSIPVED
ncbi:hypothetical protein J2Y66_003476 [Paenarthrobacter nitroguajacolicus]|uniref:hypothetical protein n=1 Tax=Paenarthrobacter nitroguajacolicus TaxID=211146 RepID=UPI002857098E|nr:hypothetical protein [Paenarthrobacter nitroguajacolicus]MDR6988968.1 hypothetical protein [Paenarthrobacter nitroguajacolicus]